MAALNLTDDIHHFRHACLRAAFINDGQVSIDTLCQRTGTDHPAHIRADHHQITVFIFFLQISCEYRGGKQIICRDIKKALYLAGM